MRYYAMCIFHKQLPQGLLWSASQYVMLHNPHLIYSLLSTKPIHTIST